MFASSHAVDVKFGHHPFSYFVENGLSPKCLYGTTLRDPVRLFWSMFHWSSPPPSQSHTPVYRGSYHRCLGMKCDRRRVEFECGFLACSRGSHLQFLYQDRLAAELEPRQQRVLQAFLQDPKAWYRGQNVMTRHLGQPVGEDQSRLSEGGFDWNIDLSLNGSATVLGEYFNRSIQRLAMFDFVFVLESLDRDFPKVFGVAAPKYVPKGNPTNPKNKKMTHFRPHGNFQGWQQQQVRHLNALDVGIYERSKYLVNQRSAGFGAVYPLCRHPSMAQQSFLIGNQTGWCSYIHRCKHPAAEGNSGR